MDNIQKHSLQGQEEQCDDTWTEDLAGISVQPFVRTSGLLVNMDENSSPFVFMPENSMYSSRISKWFDITSSAIVSYNFGQTSLIGEIWQLVENISL